MIKMNAVKTVSTLVLAFALVYGCGGGGGGSTPSPNGIYTGSISGGRTGGYNGGEKAIIYEGRTMVFSTANDINQIFDGNLDVLNNALSGDMLLFDNLNPVVIATLDVNGTYITNQSAELDFTDTDSNPIPDGTISLTEDTQIYQRGSSAATVNADWSASHTNLIVTTTISIDAQGIVSGMDNMGCTISGTVTPVESSINVYELNLVYQGCTGAASSDGSYTGLGWTEGSSDEFFNVAYTNNTFGRAVVLVRQ